MEDKSIKIGGNVSGNLVTGNVKGNISSIINELPTSPESDKPGIKELLTQLTSAIENDNNLTQEDKNEALEQVKTLAEAGKNSNDEGMKKLAKRSTTMLKGIVTGIPAASNLVDACNNLLPLIVKSFGLG